MGKTIRSKVIDVKEITAENRTINAIKSVLIYEDGLGIRRKGYYVITSLAHKTQDACIVHPCGIEKLVVDLRDKKNSTKVKEDAEISFEYESDNLQKYYIDKLSLQKI